jgi:hypothetical protein
MPVDSQSSGIQDSISPTFQKLHDLRHLVSLDTHFKKGFTEVIKYWARAGNVPCVISSSCPARIPQHSRCG